MCVNTELEAKMNNFLVLAFAKILSKTASCSYHPASGRKIGIKVETPDEGAWHVSGGKFIRK